MPRRGRRLGPLRAVADILARWKAIILSSLIFKTAIWASITGAIDHTQWRAVDLATTVFLEELLVTYLAKL